MFTLFLRALILYVVMIVTMRALGKRQLGQFQPYEFAMAILLAELVCTPMESNDLPLLYGILPVMALYVVHSLITLLSMRFDKLRAFISGKPSVVIERGQINRGELKRLCLSLSDLLEGLRTVGILDPAEVGTAVVEANGHLTAFPAAPNRQPTTSELNVATGYEGLPLPLIMDGRVQENNLQKTGRGEDWLRRVLKEHGLTIKQAYLASLDTQGRLTVQRQEGGVLRFCALDAQEVCW